MVFDCEANQLSSVNRLLAPKYIVGKLTKLGLVADDRSGDCLKRRSFDNAHWNYSEVSLSPHVRPLPHIRSGGSFLQEQVVDRLHSGGELPGIVVLGFLHGLI